jgi:hypothetical protein
MRDAMAEACPRGRPGSRGASLGHRRPSLLEASTRLFFGDPSSAEFPHLTGSGCRMVTLNFSTT